MDRSRYKSTDIKRFRKQRQITFASQKRNNPPAMDEEEQQEGFTPAYLAQLEADSGGPLPAHFYLRNAPDKTFTTYFRGKKKNMAKRRRRSYTPSMPLWDPAARRDMLRDQYIPATARGSDASRKKYGVSARLADSEQRAARLLTGFKGRGDYRSALRQFLPGFSRSVGRGLGAFFGHADKGEGLGGDFSRWVGWGKYGRRGIRGRGDYGGFAGGNQIMADSMQAPMMVNASEDLSGDIYFSHREFLGNVQAQVPASGLSSFAVKEYELNSALASTFPFLSQLAQNFTMYEFCGLVFEYRPTSGELGSTSNQLGKVIMATQYDPDAAPFVNSIQMENYNYANTCKPSEHMLHGVETDPKQTATKMLYTRTGTVTKDKIFTDLGTFQVATEGIPVAGTVGSYQNIGELWVAYKVKLSRAQLYQTLNANNFCHLIASADAASNTANTQTYLNSQPWGSYYALTTGLPNSFARRANSTLECTGNGDGITNQNFAIRFPPTISAGTYRISVQVTTGTGALTRSFSTPQLTNCTLASYPGIDGQPGATTFATAIAAATQANMTQSFIIKINAPGNNTAIVIMGLNAQGYGPGAIISILVNQINTLDY